MASAMGYLFVFLFLTLFAVETWEFYAMLQASIYCLSMYSFIFVCFTISFGQLLYLMRKHANYEFSQNFCSLIAQYAFSFTLFSLHIVHQIYHINFIKLAEKGIEDNLFEVIQTVIFFLVKIMALPVIILAALVIYLKKDQDIL